MQNDVGQTGKTVKAARFIKIGNQRAGAGLTPVAGLGRITHQGKDRGKIARTQSVPGETGKNAAGDVPAADNQYFLHAGIVAGPTRRAGVSV